MLEGDEDGVPEPPQSDTLNDAASAVVHDSTPINTLGGEGSEPAASSSTQPIIQATCIIFILAIIIPSKHSCIREPGDEGPGAFVRRPRALLRWHKVQVLGR